jgi:RNA polymerase sigma-70 factor (ECF subfamily)
MTSTDTRHYIDQLIRLERGRLIADLVARLGRQNIELAEDMVQEALTAAMQQWSYEGLPDNPAAWLNRVARNKAYDQLKKVKKEILQDTFDDQNLSVESDARILTGSKVDDPELKLIFMCCKHSLSEKEQITLILNLACGFTAKEIANVLLSSEAATAQSLSRTKRKLRDQRNDLLREPTAFDIKASLPIAYKAVYLIFCIGYASSTAKQTIQTDIAYEALRLIKTLLSNAQTASSDGHAIAALLCFQSSRFAARAADDGRIILLKNQDKSLWDNKLITEGFTHLQASKNSDNVSRYHIEAAIASVHSSAAKQSETNWQLISDLYQQLEKITASPLVTLNRAIAEMMQDNMSLAAELIEPLKSNKHMQNYAPFYLASAELLEKLGRDAEAKAAFESASKCDVNLPLKQLIDGRIDALVNN